jgi:hypothetical protein
VAPAVGLIVTSEVRLTTSWRRDKEAFGSVHPVKSPDEHLESHMRQTQRVERVAPSDGDRPILSIAWDSAAECLFGPRRWARLPQAAPSELVSSLATVEGREWQPLQDEGVVHQHGWGAYIPLATAPPPVLRAADTISTSVTRLAEARGLPAAPQFNEVTWTRYPKGRGAISPHRDPGDYHGLIAIFTLEGSAPFRVLDDESDSWSSWQTMPGDLVLLRSGWPAPGDRCPTHAAEPPPDGERMIMTLRSNRRGAGGGYSVG